MTFVTIRLGNFFQYLKCTDFVKIKIMNDLLLWLPKDIYLARQFGNNMAKHILPSKNHRQYISIIVAGATYNNFTCQIGRTTVNFVWSEIIILHFSSPLCASIYCIHCWEIEDFKCGKLWIWVWNKYFEEHQALWNTQKHFCFWNILLPKVQFLYAVLRKTNFFLQFWQTKNKTKL